MKKLLQRISHLGGLFHASNHSHPTRDWFILLGVSAVLVGAVVGWNAWVYVGTVAGKATVRETVTVPSFDTSVMDAVEKAFAARAEEAERYRSTYHFVDPSR